MRKGGVAGAPEIVEMLRALGDPERAGTMQRYFKTGPGEYAEGDPFLGITVPQVRKLAARLGQVGLPETLRLLRSPIHEARLLALIVMCSAYEKADGDIKESIFRAYLANTKFINNWDLVDVSAPRIVGAHLAGCGSRDILRRLAASKLLWERRIAIIATFYFVRRGEYADTLDIARLLLDDRSDLIHKAAGWMLREVGKQDREAEEAFLKTYCRRMPRTMLRYAIEKFPEAVRRQYLKGEIA